MTKRAERRATELLRRGGVDAPAVAVDELAAAEGIQITYSDLEDDVSGMLLRRGPRALAVINAKHPRVRQRFTIGHEVGHYLLHPPVPTHVDHLTYRFRRSQSEGDLQEREANAFAAALLMPTSMIEAEVEKGIPAYAADASASLIEEMANRFDVSTQAMTIRLTALGLIR